MVYGQTTTSRTAAEGTIQEQVQAPDRLKLELSDEQNRIYVSVDAPVIVPKADGFRMKKVTARTFIREDYDKVSQVLLEGGILKERVVDGDDPSRGFTKAELTQKIAGLQKQISEGEVEAGGTDLKERIKEFEEMLKYASDTADYAPLDIGPALDEADTTAADEQARTVSGYATAGTRDYFTVLSNRMTPDWRWVYLSCEWAGARSNYLSRSDGAGAPYPFKTSPEEFIKQAQDAAAGMGFEDFAPAAGEELVTLQDEGSTANGSSAYGIHFTRLIDGIPVTYTHNDGTSSEADAAGCWPYEALRIAYDDEGLASFIWTDPYNVEDLSDESLFLLPFDEIQSVFEQLFIKNYSDFVGEGMRLDFEITQIRLGYMRLMEKGDITQGTMIPVWDFFGNRTLSYTEPPADGQPQIIETISGGLDSWLTINAMDAAVINRDLGY